MELVIIVILIGLIPAVIAQGKGRSFVGWWVYGMLLFIIALPHSLLMKKNSASIEEEAISNGGKRCPFCAEVVKIEALKCKHCGSSLSDSSSKINDNATLEKMQESGEYPYGITVIEGKYCFDVYRYDNLDDAIKFASKQSTHS